MTGEVLQICAVYFLSGILLNRAQPDLTSSIDPRRNFVCPTETIAYSCSGLSLLIEWYAPPLVNESQSLRYSPLDTVGTILPRSSPGAQITSNLVQPSPNYVTELTVDGSVDTDLTIICRFGNTSSGFVPSSLNHRIQGSPTAPSNIVLTNIDAGLNGGGLSASWTLPDGNFDVSHFTLEVYDQLGAVTSTVRLNSTVTSLPIGVIGPVGTVSRVALITHTLCGDVSERGYSDFQAIEHSSGLLAALTIPVIMVFVVAVVIIMVLVVLLVTRSSSKVDTEAVEMK